MHKNGARFCQKWSAGNKGSCQLTGKQSNWDVFPKNASIKVITDMLQND